MKNREERLNNRKEEWGRILLGKVREKDEKNLKRQRKQRKRRIPGVGETSVIKAPSCSS